MAITPAMDGFSHPGIVVDPYVQIRIRYGHAIFIKPPGQVKGGGIARTFQHLQRERRFIRNT